MTSFLYDLRYIQAASEAIERFLLAKDTYWPIGISASAGEPSYPLLSLGGLLLAEHRAKAHVKDLADQTKLTAALEPIQNASNNWRVAWENKATAEARARINQWGNFLDEYRRDPSEHHSRYSYEVFRRVIIELLLPDTSPDSSPLMDSVRHLDQLLQTLMQPGEFIWELDLKDAFPASTYWYIYGRLPNYLGAQPDK